MFDSDLWDQFEEVTKRVYAGKDFTASVADFIHKRAAIEKDYARKLQSLCKSTEKDFGSTQDGWNSIKEETENISKKHADLGEYLSFQVEEPLLNFLKETKKQRTTLRDQGRKITKDLQTAEGKVASTKSAFEQARKKQDETKEEYERAAFTNQQSPAVEKLSKKMRADAKKSSLCDKKYNEAVDSCRVLQDKFYDDEMPRILSEFQRMEETRLDRLRLVLGAYVELQRSVSPEILSACDRMTAMTGNMDPKADIQSFVQEKKTGAVKPDRVVYEPYSAEMGKCVKQNVNVGKTSVAVAQQASPTVSSNTRAAPTQQQKATPVVARKGISQCRGLFDYSSDDPNELSFKQGDIITVLQKDPSGWWQGELNGAIGVFPSVDWVEELGANGAQRQCRALYEYNADSEFELSIRPGDIISIEGNEDGWYCGTNQKGQYGRYPSNYVEPI